MWLSEIVQVQVGWGPGQPDLLGGIPACGRMVWRMIFKVSSNPKHSQIPLLTLTALERNIPTWSQSLLHPGAAWHTRLVSSTLFCVSAGFEQQCPSCRPSWKHQRKVVSWSDMKAGRACLVLRSQTAQSRHEGCWGSAQSQHTEVFGKRLHFCLQHQHLLSLCEHTSLGHISVMLIMNRTLAPNTRQANCTAPHAAAAAAAPKEPRATGWPYRGHYPEPLHLLSSYFVSLSFILLAFNSELILSALSHYETWL